MEQFKAYFLELRKKDEGYIKTSEKRLCGNTKQDEEFSKRVSELHYDFKNLAVKIESILAQLLNYPAANVMLGIPFSRAQVISVLQDKNFTAFLLQARLFNRAVTLGNDTNAQVKIRLYFAILNYDHYVKRKWYFDRRK